MRRLFVDQELPDIPSRFDQDPCVLAREQFSAGKYYWVVQVGHRKAWNLGVCLDSLDPKGRIPKAPTNGLWALELYKETFWALTFPRVRLYPSEPLHQVGILLDCEAGRVSFYNVGSGSLIYTFSGLSFSVPLRPFFCLWTHDPNPPDHLHRMPGLRGIGISSEPGTEGGEPPPSRPMISPLRPIIDLGKPYPFYIPAIPIQGYTFLNYSVSSSFSFPVLY